MGMTISAIARPCGLGRRDYAHGEPMLIMPARRADQVFRLSMGMGGTRSAGSKPKIRPKKYICASAATLIVSALRKP